MRHRYELTILEHHLDSFGHVNNAVYVRLLEEARWDWVTRGGFGLKEVMERQIGPTILEIQIRFRKEIRLREKITIDTHIPSVQGKVFEIHHEIRNSAGELCTSAQLKAGLFDLRRRKLIDPTPEWMAALCLNSEQSV